MRFLLPETDQWQLRAIDTAVAILALPFTCLLIMLIVRIINRHERRDIAFAIILTAVCLVAGVVYLLIPRVRQ